MASEDPKSKGLTDAGGSGLWVRASRSAACRRANQPDETTRQLRRLATSTGIRRSVLVWYSP